MNPVGRVCGSLVLALGAATAVAHMDPPVAAIVPYYGATYAPPGAWSKEDVRRYLELIEEQNAILKELRDELRAARDAAPPAAIKAPDMLAVAAKKCAACHTPGKADGRGGGFILFSSDDAAALKPLSGREKARIREAVQSGTMPPNKPLTPAEKGAFR